MKKTIEDEFLDSELTDLTHKKARKKAKNSKQKGNRGERECKDILNKRFEGRANFNRSPNSGAFVGGKNFGRRDTLSEDQQLVFTSDIYCSDSKFKFSIEHKNYEKIEFWDLFNNSSDLHSWMNQAEHEAKAINKSPMLVCKFNNKKRIVFIIEKPLDPVFIHHKWNCYWFDDLLNLKDDFFFEGEK